MLLEECLQKSKGNFIANVFTNSSKKPPILPQAHQIFDVISKSNVKIASHLFIMATLRNRTHEVSEISAHGMPCMQGSCSEVYLEKAFDCSPWRPENHLPVARELGQTSLMLLVHPTLTDAEIEKTATVVRDVLQASSAAPSLQET